MNPEQPQSPVSPSQQSAPHGTLGAGLPVQGSVAASLPTHQLQTISPAIQLQSPVALPLPPQPLQASPAVQLQSPEAQRPDSFGLPSLSEAVAPVMSSQQPPPSHQLTVDERIASAGIITSMVNESNGPLSPELSSPGTNKRRLPALVSEVFGRLRAQPLLGVPLLLVPLLIVALVAGLSVSNHSKRTTNDKKTAIAQQKSDNNRSENDASKVSSADSNTSIAEAGSADSACSTDMSPADTEAGSADSAYANDEGYSDSTEPLNTVENTPIVTHPAPPPPSTPSAPKVKKILVVMIENHSYDQMKSGMPYTMGLANQYGYATNYFAITHPSEPNYLAIAGGSTFGVTNDNDASTKGGNTAKVGGNRSVFGQAIAASKTAALYAEDMSGNCNLTTQDSTGYAVKHNPWAYFASERSNCSKYDVPYTQFAGAVRAGTLPNVGMVIPNQCNDAHTSGSGTLTKADTWFKAMMTTVFAGPDWKSGNLAVILTADEDDRKHSNQVLTIVAYPTLNKKVATTKLNHYSLTKLYANVLGVTPLQNGNSAASFSAAFGLPL